MTDETTPASVPPAAPAAPAAPPQLASPAPAEPTEPTAETSGPATETTAQAPPAESAAPPAGMPAPPARTLKVVLTLAPHRADGKQDQPREAVPAVAGETVGPLYDAVLAVGADGCDPQFRSVAGTALAGALDEVPALIAEAETRWQSRPRYPRPAAPPKASKTQTAAGSARPKTQPTASSKTPASAKGATSTTSKRAPTGSPSGTTETAGPIATAGNTAKEAKATTPAPAQPRQISLFG